MLLWWSTLPASPWCTCPSLHSMQSPSSGLYPPGEGHTHTHTHTRSHKGQYHTTDHVVDTTGADSAMLVQQVDVCFHIETMYCCPVIHCSPSIKPALVLSLLSTLEYSAIKLFEFRAVDTCCLNLNSFCFLVNCLADYCIGSVHMYIFCFVIMVTGSSSSPIHHQPISGYPAFQWGTACTNSTCALATYIH